jgi:Pyridoxamine 5'-phosphate oxidase
MMMMMDQDPMTLPQGDARLLETALAQRLLRSTELARLGFVGHDGRPRVEPMLFHWTGEELVLSTFAASHKVKALRERPDVAVTIDRAGPPPEVLLLRGRLTLTEVDGLVEEYALAHVRYYGPEQGAANIAQSDRPGVRMVRLALRPAWVGLLDFTTRLPGAIAGDPPGA